MNTALVQGSIPTNLPDSRPVLSRKVSEPEKVSSIASESQPGSSPLLPQDYSPSKPDSLPEENSNVRVTLYSWSVESYRLKSQSLDGDRYEESKTSIQGQMTEIEFSGSQSSTESVYEKIQAFLKEQKIHLAHQLQKFLDKSGMGQDILSISENPLSEVISVDDSVFLEETETLEASVPEYWNAENTSERIFRFATQFYESSGLSKEEYTEKITSAIKRGYKEARDILGNLDPQTDKLLADTHKLTLDKVYTWSQVPDNAKFSAVA